MSLAAPRENGYHGPDLALQVAEQNEEQIAYDTYWRFVAERQEIFFGGWRIKHFPGRPTASSRNSNLLTPIGHPIESANS